MIRYGLGPPFDQRIAAHYWGANGTIANWYNYDIREKDGRCLYVRRPSRGWSEGAPIWAQAEERAPAPHFEPRSDFGLRSVLNPISRLWPLAPCERLALQLAPEWDGHPVGFGLGAIENMGRCPCHDLAVAGLHFYLWPFNLDGARLPPILSVERVRLTLGADWRDTNTATGAFLSAWNFLRSLVLRAINPDEEPARSELAGLGWRDDLARRVGPLQPSERS